MEDMRLSIGPFTRFLKPETIRDTARWNECASCPVARTCLAGFGRTWIHACYRRELEPVEEAVRERNQILRTLRNQRALDAAGALYWSTGVISRELVSVVKSKISSTGATIRAVLLGLASCVTYRDMGGILAILAIFILGLTVGILL